MSTSINIPKAPWFTEAFDTANGTQEQVFALVDNTPVEICDISTDHPDGGIAIARLIAAAPELLAELREAEGVIRWAVQESSGRVKAEIVGGWLHHANKISAAIAKAEGRA